MFQFAYYISRKKVNLVKVVMLSRLVSSEFEPCLLFRVAAQLPLSIYVIIKGRARICTILCSLKQAQAFESYQSGEHHVLKCLSRVSIELMKDGYRLRIVNDAFSNRHGFSLSIRV